MPTLSSVAFPPATNGHVSPPCEFSGFNHHVGPEHSPLPSMHKLPGPSPPQMMPEGSAVVEEQSQVSAPVMVPSTPLQELSCMEVTLFGKGEWPMVELTACTHQDPIPEEYEDFHIVGRKIIHCTACLYSTALGPTAIPHSL